MENRYFNTADTLWSITERYPETVDVFVSQDFNQMRDDGKRKAFGSTISLTAALSLKKINPTTFIELLVDRIEQQGDGVAPSLRSKVLESKAGDLRIQGLLPCPVRIPLMEQLEAFVTDYKTRLGDDIHYDLKAASMGLDWLKESLVNEDDPRGLADIFISAGFDLFFDMGLMGKFKRKNVFADSTGFKRLNSIFANDRIDLKDPAGHYSMIGVVPAVFLVNRDELNGRPIPRRWSDLLKPEFTRSISLPIGDFDLFNAILLHLHKEYGAAAVEQLGRSLMQSMHPSQMVKSHQKKSAKPAVTIMPYFFTKMVKEGGTMVAVWPEDGAVISPIFMLSKREKIHRLQPLIDFFASREVGEILAHKGLFPSLHPEVDNRIPGQNTFRWLGWDYIYSHDIGQLIRTCNELFDTAVRTEEEK
jgi:ABC-type Fe3+ transport system substrate-binding protein